MLTIYTPATGFPDLEIKIAYGLARVGIEAGYDFSLIPDKGFYRIEFQASDLDKLNSTFLHILSVLLSSDKFFDLGVKARYKNKYPVHEKIIKKLDQKISSKNFTNLFDLKIVSNLNIKKDYFCGHEDIEKFGGSGLILLSSFHAGKPYERNKRFSTFNQSLCALCGYLAVLGLYSFGFQIQMGKEKNRKYVIVLPMPQQKMTHIDLKLLLSLQKTLHNFWLSDIQPLRTFPIGLLSKVPSLSDIINDMQLTFQLYLLSKDNRGDTIVEESATVEALPFSKFIASSSYNSATIDKLLGSYKNQPKISSLIEITNALEHKDKEALLKFARLYVQETSTNNFTNLLYPETTRYFLKEVAMIKEDIMKNKAVRSIAKTLGYFVWNRDYQNYSFVDGLRNAKTSKDVRQIFEKLVREAKLRYDQERTKEKGTPPHLPHPEDIEEINRLMQSDQDSFEQVITTLYLLAFSFESYKTIRIEDEK
uniref:Type I-B CRISPR-associated protein Cas8b1/Cst1 n=1 Tax=candidate division WOR-3 bacterium TaxID=2052148 RepID=A0A7V3ZSH5_UNCW3